MLIGVAQIDLSGLFLKENILGEEPSLNGFYHIRHEGKEESQG